MKKSWRNNVEFYLIGLLALTVAAFSITMPEIFWSISNFPVRRFANARAGHSGVGYGGDHALRWH
ncbi:permease component of sugar ABC transport system [Escherichia coli]|uniref:Permease component of sugar ABC transport system n=1 Tax=Escherichia coli TaxID=562 RepID=A0AAX2KG11_ECOLX|nr:permease component of sugar ABC transport system [Escherichia coli]